MLKTSTISLENFFESAHKKTTITEDRKIVLSNIVAAIAQEYSENKTVNLNFICTHNSRRSQLGQVWSFFAATYFNLNINAFSGGTEVTAFYKNTVKTLQKVGFEFQLTDFSHQNPTYQISFNGTENTTLGFSKLYSNPINTEPFMAITTCNNADTNCPFIPTASHRFHLPFIDPKHSDGTTEQEDTYLQTSIQIAGEVYFIFSEVKKLI
jgi:arsenate reductase